MYIRLEYSESTGHFHFSGLNEKGENTNGYTTLSSKVNSYQAEHFCEQLRQKFPSNTNRPTHLSFAQVKDEFLNFIREELKTMRDALAATHKYRSHIYYNQ